MAEAIALTSSILAIATFSFRTTTLLYEEIQCLESQRKTVTDLHEEIGSLNAALSSLTDQLKDHNNDLRFEPLRNSLYNCAKTCEELGEMLTVCTSHSKEGKDSVRDWLKMRYRGKSFDDIKQRLLAYKSTLIVAHDSVNL